MLYVIFNVLQLPLRELNVKSFGFAHKISNNFLKYVTHREKHQEDKGSQKAQSAAVFEAF